MLRQIYKRYNTQFMPEILLFLLCTILFLCGLSLSLLSTSPWLHGKQELSMAVTATLPPQLLPTLLRPVGEALTSLYQGALQWLDRQASLLTFTDPAATYDSPAVKEMWTVVLIIADGTIGIFIVLAGYRVIFSGFGGGNSYVQALEELPRLVFACIGANISLLFARFWIDLNNLLCGILLAQTNGHPISIVSVATITAFLNILLLPLFALLVLLIVLLGIQMAVRLGMIIFLTIWLPVLFIMLASRHTQQFAQAGIRGYPTVVLTQMLQISCLTLGVKVLLPFLSLTIGPETAIAPIATILAGIALFWITLRIPSMLRSWALQPVAESGHAVVAVVNATMTRFLFRI